MHKISDAEKELLKDINVLDFDIFKFSASVGREKSMILLATNMINSHRLFEG